MASSPTAGSLVRASDAFNFVTFTPTWTSVTIGTGADSEGWYQVIGNMVMWGFRLEFGTSPSWAAGTVLLNLPVAAYTGGGGSLAACVGQWSGRSSASINYGSSIMTNDTAGTQCNFAGAWNGTSPSGRVGASSSTPFTPASGNVFSGSGCYRAA